MAQVSALEQAIINQLNTSWIWLPNYTDSPPPSINTAGLLATFTRFLTLSSHPPCSFKIHISADTRYKLLINSRRVAVGPSRGSPLICYYDSIDITPYLQKGENEVKVVVLRYFNANRAAMAFERTAFAGLSIVGSIVWGDGEMVDLGTRGGEGWSVSVDGGTTFPVGLIDDGFLHISERVTPTKPGVAMTPVPYKMGTLNGDLLPWRLRPRPIPMPEENKATVNIVRKCQSQIPLLSWTNLFSQEQKLHLPSNSSHVLELQADVHSTAFLRWTFTAMRKSQVRLKITYSEGYELEPRSYPYFRHKADRLDAENGHLLGPHDEFVLDIPIKQIVTYEPFWFRTFRIMRLEIEVGPEEITFVSFSATQTNYPMAVKASWKEEHNLSSAQIWQVSIRTMRNCMFDGYSDCPFYEQLQYAGDTRTVSMFHYLLSGDDLLMRQAMTNWAASITFEGLTQSRFPSHVPQIIAGFSLYWILQICDHYLFFGDKQYTRSFLPRVDGVLDFFEAHVDELGLVSNLPYDVWQYVDWVTMWGATEVHPDKGVPISGRKSNRHTYFSMLYACTLKQAAKLLRDVGRPALADEYEARAESLLVAIRKHCYDGRFFTDSTADIADDLAYSQHCQVFAILSGAVETRQESARLIKESFHDSKFSKCSYMMKFYAFRAFALAGDELYEALFQPMLEPYRKMLANNLTTWEEDDVRQRSDCHAWGSVPVYEYCTEVAGIQPIGPGCTKVLFKPRLNLSKAMEAKVALGKNNIAEVKWSTESDGRKLLQLKLDKKIEVVSQLPGCEEIEHGKVDFVTLVYDP